jgi:hypothetical protein
VYPISEFSPGIREVNVTVTPVPDYTVDTTGVNNEKYYLDLPLIRRVYIDLKGEPINECTENGCIPVSLVNISHVKKEGGGYTQVISDEVDIIWERPKSQSLWVKKMVVDSDKRSIRFTLSSPWPKPKDNTTTTDKINSMFSGINTISGKVELYKELVGSVEGTTDILVPKLPDENTKAEVTYKIFSRSWGVIKKDDNSDEIKEASGSFDFYALTLYTDEPKGIYPNSQVWSMIFIDHEGNPVIDDFRYPERFEPVE